MFGSQNGRIRRSLTEVETTINQVMNRIRPTHPEEAGQLHRAREKILKIIEVEDGIKRIIRNEF